MAAVTKKARVVRSLEGRDANARVVMTCAEMVVAPRVAGREKKVALKAVARFEKCAEVFATDDPCDRAHLVRASRDGMLSPAAGLSGLAKARRYPKCYMHEVVEGRLEEEMGGLGDGEMGGQNGSHSLSPHLPISPSPHRSLRLVERAVAIVSDETVFDETFEAQCRLAGAMGSGTGRRMREGAVDWDHPRLRDICEPGPRFREPLVRELVTEGELRELVMHRRVRVRMTSKEGRIAAAADRLLAAAGVGRDGLEKRDFGDTRPYWERGEEGTEALRHGGTEGGEEGTEGGVGSDE